MSVKFEILIVGHQEAAEVLLLEMDLESRIFAQHRRR